MNKKLIFACIFAAQLLLGGTHFTETVFPTQARAVARNTVVGSAGVLLAVAVGEMVAKSIRSLPPTKTRENSARPTLRLRLVRCTRATKKVAGEVFCSLKLWKALGADLAALFKPPTKDGTSQTSIFYAKHSALCWATGIATAYTVAAWTRYGMHSYNVKQAKKNRSKQLKKTLQQHVKALGQINFLKKLAQTSKAKKRHQEETNREAARRAELERKRLADEQTKKEKEGAEAEKAKERKKAAAGAAQMHAQLATIETQKSAAKAKATASAQPSVCASNQPYTRTAADTQKIHMLNQYLVNYWNNHDPQWRRRGRPVVAAPAPGTHTCTARCKPNVLEIALGESALHQQPDDWKATASAEDAAAIERALQENGDPALDEEIECAQHGYRASDSDEDDYF